MSTKDASGWETKTRMDIKRGDRVYNPILIIGEGETPESTV